MSESKLLSGLVYQFRVVLAGISPLIFRRLQVTDTTTIAGLHVVLQTVFGWSDEHLHRFTVHGVEYGLWLWGLRTPIRPVSCWFASGDHRVVGRLDGRDLVVDVHVDPACGGSDGTAAT